MSRKILESLNPEQKAAVFHGEGPLLILAGAGSGKTKVIAHRFAHLAGKLSSDHILTATFTNKAADEMKERIVSLTKKDLQVMWIGTLHSQCSKVLRREIKPLGYKSDFSILDEDDQSNLIRHILREFKMYEALYKGILSRISLLKSSLIGPQELLSRDDMFGFEDKLARVYIRYQDELRKSNALDFDDLILLTIRLFEEYPKVLRKYQGIFEYILVDEFQDINYAQYKLLCFLADSHKNICVVGDDDQSIYGFRGADKKSLLNFEKDFPEVKVVRLEQNYRSTKTILDVAGKVIKDNTGRYHKRLWTERTEGEKVYLCKFETEEDESRCIAKFIKGLYLKGSYNYRDFAIFYRVGLQSRAIEEALQEEGLPYWIVGGTGFYQRREIRDLIAYMRLAVNHDNNVSLRRIMNSPPRGIGTSTLSRLEQIAKKKTISLFSAMKDILKTNAITPSIKEKLEDFIELIEASSPKRFRDSAGMLRHIYNETGYADFLSDEKADTIMELIKEAGGKGVKEFLDRISMLTNMDDTNKEDAISLMTLHSAKGLEFPVVFIIGLEEGMLPYFKAKSLHEIEEERRLLYVGMTRAKDILWLTTAKKRRLYTKIQEQQSSRFLADIPQDCCQNIERTPYHLPEGIEKKPKTFRHIPYSIGSRVRHPVWGVGVVRDFYGVGDEQKITVNFPNVGVKRLALKFVNLQRI